MAHMVEQVIKYSDGTETVISYRGKIVDGVLIPNEEIKMEDKEMETPVEQADVTADATIPATPTVEVTEEE